MLPPKGLPLLFRSTGRGAGLGSLCFDPPPDGGGSVTVSRGFDPRRIVVGDFGLGFISMPSGTTGGGSAMISRDFDPLGSSPSVILGWFLFAGAA